MTEKRASSTILWKHFAIVFLLCEGVGATIWWGVLWMYPAVRSSFKAFGAPDSTLIAFSGADLIFFVGCAFAAAIGYWRKSSWAWPLLCLHTGAASYAALYCLSLSLLSGDAWLGTILMAPSLVVLPVLTWRLWQVY